MLSTRNPLQVERDTETARKGMEKDISCKWKQMERAGVAILISDKTDFTEKQRRTFHNDKGNNPAR